MNPAQGSMVCCMGFVGNGLLEEGKNRKFHKPFTKITTIPVNVGKLGNFCIEFYKMMCLEN